MKDFKSYANNGGNQGSNTGSQSGGYQNGNTGNTQGTGGAYGSYSNGNGNAGSQNAGAGCQNSNLNQTVNMATMIAKAFNGKSEGQILQTILAQAEEGKRAGTLTNADLDNFYAAVAPMLDGFKRQRLKGIIAKLKSI